VVLSARAAVAAAVGGRPFLLRLRPEDAVAAPVAAMLGRAREEVLERAEALGEDVAAVAAASGQKSITGRPHLGGPFLLLYLMLSLVLLNRLARVLF
jgi:hypothetical protein